VQKAYRLHPTFGEGLMRSWGFQIPPRVRHGNKELLFARVTAAAHGCTQEPGEQWRAAGADWYRETRFTWKRPIVKWYVLYETGKVVSHKIRGW